MADPVPQRTEVPESTDSSGTTSALVRRFYEELRRIAASFGREARPARPSSPPRLVHEAYLRLTRGSAPRWESRRHFFGARRRRCARSSSSTSTARASSEAAAGPACPSRTWTWPSTRRRRTCSPSTRRSRGWTGRIPRLGEVVRLRYFAGLSVEETAEVLGLSASTVKRDWRFIKAWLASEMDLDGNGDAGPGRGDGR